MKGDIKQIENNKGHTKIRKEGEEEEKQRIKRGRDKTEEKGRNEK